MSTLRRLGVAFGLQALAGLALWLVLVGAAALTGAEELDGIALLLLFAQLVIVPLGLVLLEPRGRVERALVGGARFGFRVGGVAAVAAVAVPRGEASAAIAALYLVPALAVGALGALRLAGRAWRSPAELGRAAAAGFLAVGALFFVLDRQGIVLPDQPAVITRLTAVHFHVAGFGLALLAACLADRSGRAGLAAVCLVVGGMVVTAAGFLVDPLLQAAGAGIVVAGLGTVAIGTLAVLLTGSIRRGRALLAGSCAASLPVGALALVYAAGELAGAPAVPIPLMAAVHGTAGALGVVGCGLAGWRLARER